MLSSPHAVVLAAHIVSEHFGKSCEATCKSLLNRGVQTLTELGRSTGQPPAQLRESLLVLQQHSCVRAYLVEEEARLTGEIRSHHVYEASATAIVQRLRMPHILRNIQQQDAQPRIKQENGYANGGPSDMDIDDEEHKPHSLSPAHLATAIIAVLLEHGRLRPSQTVAAAGAKLGSAQAELTSRLHAAFKKLVRERCIERCPPCQLPRVMTRIHPAAMTRRGAAQRQRDQAEQSEAAISAREAVAAFEKLRFNPGVPAGDGTASPAPGKRKYKRLARALDESDDEQDEKSSAREFCDDGVLWRVNQEEFTQRFRREACIDHVAERHDDRAAAVVAAMLRSLPGNQGAWDPVEGEEQSLRMSQTQVWTATRKAVDSGDPWAASMPSSHQHLAATLRQLSGPSGQVLQQAGSGPTQTYCLDVGLLLETIRHRELQAALRDKFGVHGLRIFNLLADQRQQLEQKQISEKAMLQLKDAREALYRMFHSHYLSLQDIPRTNDHAPSRTFYTFRADKEDAFKTMQHDIVHALLNIRLRLEHELWTEQELFGLLSGGSISAVLLETHGQQIQRIKWVTKLMQGQILRLLEQLNLFANY